MRYILNAEGYVIDLFFGCSGEGCTEYTGAVPEGYISLDEWADTANINAYKIVDGNLVYDAVKDAELTAFNNECENLYGCATKKYVQDAISRHSQVISEEFTGDAVGDAVTVINDAGAYEIPLIEITRKITYGQLTGTYGDLHGTYGQLGNVSAVNALKIAFSNGNILPIEAVDTTINDVAVTINENHSITLKGTAAEAGELNLAGTENTTGMLFNLSPSRECYLSGLKGMAVKMYSYNGTDRALIYDGTDGAITVNELTEITQVVLSIPSGKIDITISPQIEIGAEATPYKEHCGGFITIEHPVNMGDKITIENGAAYFTRQGGKQQYLYEVVQPCSYEGDTVIMTSCDAKTKCVYFRKKVIEDIYDEFNSYVGKGAVISSINQSAEKIRINAPKIALEGYTTINDGFSIDESGNMTCNDAQFTGGNIELKGDGESKELFAVYDTDETEYTYIASKYVSTGDVAETRRVRLMSNQVYTGVQGHSQGGGEFMLTALSNGGAILTLYNSNGVSTSVNATGITTPSLTQTSTEKGKKNFKKVKGTSHGYTDIIKNGDIYEYNLKFEKDTDRKRLGFVIGDGYNVPPEVIAKDENGDDVGINLYSMCSILWQAVKELTAEVEQLKGEKKK